MYAWKDSDPDVFPAVTNFPQYALPLNSNSHFRNLIDTSVIIYYDIS
jgi:hypothetical protein